MGQFNFTLPTFAGGHRKPNFVLIGCLMVFAFFYLFYAYHPRSGHFTPNAGPSKASLPNKPTQRFAYATFLSSRPDGDIEKDAYVMATRVLAYQLLHHPVTGTKRGIPFLVIVPPHVPQSIRDLVSSEGATVIAVENINPTSWKSSPALSRWIDQYTKLRIFELTDYDRVAYMDNDMLITRCLDSVFESKEVQTITHTKNSTEEIKQDEITMPPDYSIAGVADQEGPNGVRPRPITDGSRLNGGFWVTRPDKALFEYYVSVLEHGQSGRFDAGMMEMGLLNYAHRFSGNMPWTPLEVGQWGCNWPSWSDFERGCAALHDKFWVESNKDWIDRRLVEMWWRVQGRMEGFWQSKGRKDRGVKHKRR